MRSPPRPHRNLTAGWRAAFIRRCCFLPLAILFTACTASYYQYKADISARLAAVDPPGPVRELKGLPDSTVYDFADDWLRIQWAIGTDARLDFVLFNRSDDTLRVHWEDARYIDQRADTHRVLHTAVLPRYGDRPRFPSPVPPQGRLVDYVLPEHLVVRDPFRPDMTIRDLPLFHLRDASARDMRREAVWLQGRQTHILLPLAIGNATRTYRFTFQIDKVTLR